MKRLAQNNNNCLSYKFKGNKKQVFLHILHNFNITPSLQEPQGQRKKNSGDQSSKGIIAF